MGNTCKSMADLSMYGKTHYNIVINLQLIKINEKKKDLVCAYFCNRTISEFILSLQHIMPCKNESTDCPKCSETLKPRP